ncbi:MAG: adenylate/guanylate cyclase domain-containing protein [Methylacidiphilales bacterium]|nr:adenylate/guanylate cyclase domain-containing protein [Candidatus Methylacidiphilales bacterium]
MAITLGVLGIWFGLDYLEDLFESDLHYRPLARAELATDDARARFGRLAPINPNLVFLAIDGPSIKLDALDDATIANSKGLLLIRASDGFPFQRSVYGEVCDRLFGAGAKVVGFDLIFRDPKPEDADFRQVMDKYPGRIVVGMNFADGLNGFTLPPSTLLPSQSPTDEQVGYLNYFPDEDAVVRDTHYRINLEYINSLKGAENLPMTYSLAARMAENAGGLQRPPNDMDAHVFRFGGAHLPNIPLIPSYSLYTIFDPHAWASNFQNGAYFKDKIVLVGPEGNWFKDVQPTPFGIMAGAEIHLNAMNALLENDFLQRPSAAFSRVMIFSAAALALALALVVPNIAGRFAAAVLVTGVYVAAILRAYNGPGWLLPAVGPVGVFGGAMGVGTVYDFVLAQVEKMQLRAAFQRYTSPNVAKYLLDHLESYQEMLAGSRQPVTVLFSDVRGFTTKTEAAAAEGKSQQHIAKLNEYLTEMVACVFRYDGALDKFIGDAVMAVWGNTPYNFGPKEDAVRAVRSAREMLAELGKLNAKWKAQGREEWHIGIGLNHGEAIVGDIGSQQQRTEYAVIGDAVNLASRLESLTKEYHLELLLGESVADLVRDVFYLRTVDLVVVVGKTKAVEAFTVIGEKSEGLAPEMQKFLETYEEGVRAFRSREFGRAAELFEEALKIQPGDLQAEAYLANCREFIRNPPDEAWTGVRVMTKK